MSETRNAGGEPLGEKKLRQLLAETVTQTRDAETGKDFLLGKLAAHRGEAPLSDDQTFVLIRHSAMNPNHTQKILVADDEVFMLRLLEMTFKKGGYEVDQLPRRPGGARRRRRRLPQLIVLDVMMPGLDGLGALRQLKENPATQDIPVVVLSAKGHALTKVEAESRGRGVVSLKTVQPKPASRRSAKNSRAARIHERRRQKISRLGLWRAWC